jgi:predicted Zn-dependent protease
MPARIGGCACCIGRLPVIGRRHALGLLAGVAAVSLGGCEQATSLLVSPQEETSMGVSAFNQLKQEVPISTDRAAQRRLQEIGQRIVPASGAEIAADDWEFVVFDSDELNAFALPGGRVGFYEGILKIMDNDAQIATVMGHEIGHVNAHHSAKRLAGMRASSIGLQAASAALQMGQVGMSQEIAAAMGLGVQYGVILPYSRANELEADRLGLTYMARAGYDPEEALVFWQRFAAKTAQGAPPAFLSTHPAGADRIAQFRELMPEAEALYGQSRAA